MSDQEAKTCSPITFWGQDEQFVYLRVQVQGAENVRVNFDEESIEFSCVSDVGIAYSFKLDLYLNVQLDLSEWKMDDSRVRIILKKEHDACWPRLTFGRAKQGWLKPDFDHFQLPDDSDEDLARLANDDQDQPKVNVKYEFPKNDFDKKEDELKLREEEWLAYKAMFRNPLVIYLLVLYVYQLAGSLAVSSTCLGYKFKWKNASQYNNVTMTFENNLDRVLLVHLGAFFELLNVAVGLETKASLVNVLLKFLSRNLTLFLCVVPFDSIRGTETVINLFLAWSLYDILEYVYMIVLTIDEEYGLMEYLKHTAWIVFLPTIFHFEAYIQVLALPLLAETGKFSLSMPNRYNMSVDMAYILTGYLVFSAFLLLVRMDVLYHERREIIGPKPRVGAPEMSGLRGLLGLQYADYLRQSIKSREASESHYAGHRKLLRRLEDLPKKRTAIKL